MSVHLPRVLCRGFLSSTGVHMACVHPVIQPGELGGRVIENGQCSLCAALHARATEATQRRTEQRTARRAAKGYGPAADGVDVFQQFREDGK